MLSIEGYPSSMALGRNLFIFSNHFLFVVARDLFHVQPQNAYLIFKYAVVAQAPGIVMAEWSIVYGGMTYPYQTLTSGSTSAALLAYLDAKT